MASALRPGPKLTWDITGCLDELFRLWGGKLGTGVEGVVIPKEKKESDICMASHGFFGS